jgi:uncharacterized NAD(P)/FAD-binding protein YdhS
MQAKNGRVHVTHRPRRATADHHLEVELVINCSAPCCDYHRIADPLIRRLLERGDIRPDPLRLGLDVSSVCALRNRQGEIWQRLYAVGPVTKPLFWEVTSVPDIRRQCEALAALLSARLAPILPSHTETGVIASPQRGVQHDFGESAARPNHHIAPIGVVPTDLFLR